MTERLTIANGERLTVAEGSTLTVAGEVYNYGNIVGSTRIFCDHLYNFGTIDHADWLTGFTATATGPTAIELAWSTSRPADIWTIERKLQSEESWTTLDDDVSGASWTDTPPRANVKYDYRITNNTDAAVTATDPAWLTTIHRDNSGTSSDSYRITQKIIPTWQIRTKIIMATASVTSIVAGSTPAFAAQIKNTMTGEWLAAEDVAAIKYTITKHATYLNTRQSPVTGHNNVSIPLTAVLEQPVTADYWDVDSTGYNFLFEPDGSVNPAFPEVGLYRVQVTIQLTAGNNIVLKYELSVI